MIKSPFKIHLINYTKYIFLLLLLVTLSSNISNDLCESLQSGKYFAVFDDQFSNRYGRLELTVQHNKALINAHHLTGIFKIESKPGCKFEFIPSYPDTSNLNALQRQLAGLGTPYYEVDYIHKDTLRFVYRRNPHITIYSGKFIYSKTIARQKVTQPRH